jgi:hypothetical protein
MSCLVIGCTSEDGIMVDLSDISGRHYTNLNCAICFSCDEQTYHDVIALISTIKGANIFYTKSSRLRLVVEERGF